MNKIRRCDIIVAIILFMVFGVHMMTNIAIQLKAKETKASVESVAKAYEANPFAILQGFTNKLFIMIFLIVKPALVLFIYWLIRRKVKEGTTEVLVLESFVMLLFFVMIVNFLNDLSVLMGMLAKGLI